MSDDTIYRQAAIDMLMKEWEAYKNYPYMSHVKHGLEIAIMLIENKLPSAQPENIRCRDCKNWDKTWTNDWSPEYHYCPMIDGARKGDFYCADAERRTDE